MRPGVIHKATCLSKADLTTELVKEFTELQGIVGGLYARVQQLDPSLPEATRFAIADAIYDHYKPESTDDAIPRSMEGAVLSIGDKADTIAGMFALGLVPSGSRDPFALRRQANAIVKIIAEKKLPLRLGELMRDARSGYQKSEAEKKFVDDTQFSESVAIFFRERLEFYLKDVCGYAYDVVKAVLASDAEDVVAWTVQGHHRGAPGLRSTGAGGRTREPGPRHRASGTEPGRGRAMTLVDDGCLTAGRNLLRCP